MKYRVKYGSGEYGEWSETIPTGKKAGTYKVQYFSEGDTNHNDTDKDTLTIEIKQSAFVRGSAVKAKSGAHSWGTAADAINQWATSDNGELSTGTTYYVLDFYYIGGGTAYWYYQGQGDSPKGTSCTASDAGTVAIALTNIPMDEWDSSNNYGWGTGNSVGKFVAFVRPDQMNIVG